MNYWNNERNVEEYNRMTEGYDGSELIEVLKKYLPIGSSVLELGMGSGKDLDILNEFYTATGTDVSHVFIEQYKKKHEDSDVFVLDAVSLETQRMFDCIYSNKVLQHLTKPDFVQSLKNQKKLLNPNGLLFHSLWKGDTEEEYGELLFVYYTEEILREIVREEYDIVKIGTYTEADENDSLYIILKKTMK